TRCTPTSTLFPYTTLFRSQRRVAEVVEEDREPQRLPEAVAIGGLELELRRERIEQLGGHRHRAEPVGVARVRRTGEREVGEPERSEEHTSELQSLAYLVCR